MNRILFIAAFISLLAITIHGQEFPCTYGEYDLSHMYRAYNQDDYIAKGENHGDTFYVNICGDSKAPCVPANGVCFQYSQHSFHGCGAAADATFGDYPTGEEGVQLIYTHGEMCNGQRSVSTINILCDRYQAGTGLITAIDQSIVCSYTIYMKSKYACKGGPVPTPTPTPTPTIPDFSSLNVSVFVYGTVEGRNNFPTALTGEGVLLYSDASDRNLELAATTNGTVQGTFGVLANSASGMTVINPLGTNNCPVFNDALDIANANMGVPLANSIQSTYTYQYFQLGTTRPATKWYLDSDEVRYITDTRSGDLIWAPLSLFAEMKSNNFFADLYVEVDPSRYQSVPPGYDWKVPSEWNCSLSIVYPLVNGPVA